MTPKKMKEFQALAQQLTVSQQVHASIDAIDYYHECMCDGMSHKEARKAAEKRHIDLVRAMVNDKVLTSIGI